MLLFLSIEQLLSLYTLLSGTHIEHPRERTASSCAASSFVTIGNNRTIEQRNNRTKKTTEQSNNRTKEQTLNGPGQPPGRGLCRTETAWSRPGPPCTKPGPACINWTVPVYKGYTGFAQASQSIQALPRPISLYRLRPLYTGFVWAKPAIFQAM